MAKLENLQSIYNNLKSMIPIGLAKSTALGSQSSQPWNWDNHIPWIRTQKWNPCHEGQSKVPSSTKHNCISCFSFAKTTTFDIYFFRFIWRIKLWILQSFCTNHFEQLRWSLKQKLTQATRITCGKAPGLNMGRCKQLSWPKYGSLTQDLKIHCDMYPRSPISSFMVHLVIYKEKEKWMGCWLVL